MTWTYDGDPSANTRDEVRYLVGDTDPVRELAQDEEIAYWIARCNTVYDGMLMVAAAVAEQIAARAASEVSQSGDGVSISADQLQQKFTDLADNLRSQYTRFGGAGATPYVGSNDRSHVPENERGWAAIGQHDNPDAGWQIDGTPCTDWRDPGEAW